MAVEEKKKLQKSLRRFDMLFFTVCALVGLDTLGQVSSWGAQTFTWLVVLAVALCAALRPRHGRAGQRVHPGGRPVRVDEAVLGPVLGRHRRRPLLGHEPAVGRRVAGVHLRPRLGAATSPRSVPARSATTSSRSSSSGSRIGVAIVSLRRGKWIPNVGAMIRLAVLAFFSLTVVIYAIKHGVHGYSCPTSSKPGSRAACSSAWCRCFCSTTSASSFRTGPRRR